MTFEGKPPIPSTWLLLAPGRWVSSVPRSCPRSALCPAYPRPKQSPKRPCASCGGSRGIEVPTQEKTKAMLNTGHGNDTAPRIPLSPSDPAGDDALSGVASPSGHPLLCKAGHKPVPTPGAACAEPPACPPDPMPWLLEGHGEGRHGGSRQRCVRTCSLAIALRRRVPARVTPAGSGGARHRRDRRV